MADTVRITSPIDGSVYAERPYLGDADLERALESSRSARRAWIETSLSERSRILHRMLDELRRRNDEITVELAWQMGRPVRYGGELKGVEERTRYMTSIAEEALAPLLFDDRPGFQRSIERGPLGTVLVIGPWNYPYLTVINAIVPGLLAGNSVLLKPASQTLLVGETLQRALEDAGAPPGLLQSLVLRHEQVADLLTKRRVDHISFTGSVEGGRAIERAAAGSFLSVTLELGGKDPAYVRADALLEPTLESLVDGACYNSGQCCCGVERIYVHRDRFEAFVDGFVERTRRYVLGNPLDPNTTLGPMAHLRFAEVVRAHVDEAIARGARAHIDARDFPAAREGSPYVAPQVLTRVDHSLRVMREETFGPVVGIQAVRDDDEAVRLMNDSPFGLTASVWTEDSDAVHAIGEQVDTGTFFQNRCDYLDPALAWTGVKDSGRGVSLSILGLEAMTRPKSYHLRRTLG